MARLSDVIRIETPFLNLQGNDQAEQVGNLVIIDTPGPNEAGENLRLTEVVKEQLRRSSIVLIVLDFTQLNNEAAEKVKKQVQPIIDLIGKDNLYVLVNKIDERRTGGNSMTTEQVKEFVRADLQLAKSETNNVFEISARQAFVAAKFMCECDKTDNLDLDSEAKGLKTSEALAQEVFGIDWEEDLQEVTVEKLLKKSRKLWDKSGFALFLTQAVNALMESAAPRCMRSALNLSRSRLVNVKEDLRLRSSAIAKDEKKLRDEVDALEADLKRLELCRKQLSEINKVQKELKNEIDRVFNLLKDEARVSIQDYFGKEDLQRKNAIQQIDIKMREFLLSPIAGFDPFNISEKLKSTFGYKLDKPLEFTTHREAEKFRSDAISWAKNRADKLLERAREYTGRKIDEARKNYIKDIDAETRPIIDKARQRLNQEFDVELSLPELPSWQDSRLEESVITIDLSNRAKKVQLSDKKRRWYVLWLVEIEHKWEETVNEQYYLVSLESLVNAFNDSITKAVDNINDQIEQYLNNEFKEEFNRYFNCLDEYLCNYRDSLRQAQEDQKLNLEDQQKLTQDMLTLSSEADGFIQSVDRYLKRTENFLD